MRYHEFVSDGMKGRCRTDWQHNVPKFDCQASWKTVRDEALGAVNGATRPDGILHDGLA